MNDLVVRVEQTTQCLRRSSRLLATSAHTVALASLTPEPEPTASHTKKRKRKLAVDSETEEGETAREGGTADVQPSPRTRKSANKKTSSVRKVATQVDGDDWVEASSPSKPRKKREPKPEPVYIIPDVARKETTFKGRLGYACLNTILRTKKPATEAVFCSRTCRLDSLRKNGLDWVKELGRKNVQDLLTILQWNEANNIRFFRLSSEMFPFASHGQYGYSLDYCADELAKAGAFAREHGHRLTTHPGQFTQLGSPKPAVVEAAIRDLEYHRQMLELLGTGPDSVMIIHGGGVYGDKVSTLERLKENLQKLPHNIRDRLVLENDEICYNAEDLLPICEELSIPLVFGPDYHHDRIFPSSIPPKTIIERANVIWKRRGIKPKQHLSEERPGAITVMERRAHADRCENLPEDLPDDMDLMIEAKDKEQAVLYLHRMYNLQPVIYESLRPAAANPSKQTAGRKSTERARANATKELAKDKDEQEESSELSGCDSGEDEEVLVDEPSQV
ncbi:UV-endonuclease UvdE [Agrocybe pediades]|nr:UV-endonuclease UvdE [Agrocybe pediades]